MKNRASSLIACFVLALASLSCSDQRPDPISTQASRQLLLVSGDNQTARVRDDVPAPLVVKLLDTDARPMPGVPVFWTVVSGGGSITVVKSTTDQQGYAEAAWTLGGVAAEQRAKANFGSLTVSFAARATAGEPASIARWSGEGQLAITGTQLNEPISVVIRDADENPVPGVTVNWDVLYGNGTVSPNVSVTDQDGVARTSWTMGLEVGGSVARAALAGVGDAQFFAEALDPQGKSAPQQISRVVVSPDGASISAIGATTTVTASAYLGGQKVDGVTIGWTSLNPGIARVDENGRVTAVAPGQARVVAKALCCNKSDTARILVAQQATSLSIAPKPITLPVGSTANVSAAAIDAGGTTVPGTPITWSSSNTTVATVSQGVITGLKAGTAKVRAASGSLLDSVAVTVGTTTTSPAVASISVAPASLSLALNQGFDLTATAADASGNPISGQSFSWSSSNTSVAAVSTTGRVTALTAGTATVTARIGDRKGTAQISVSKEPVAVASVTLSPTSASVATGGTLQLSASARDAKGQTLTGYTFAYASSNPKVATVNASGVVSGLSAGTAQISASAGGKTAYASVTVSTSTTGQNVARLVLTPDTVRIKALGNTAGLAATAYDANGQVLPGTAVTWNSTNATVATVDTLGRVTARGVGTALIVAAALCCNDADTTTAVITQQMASLTVSPHTTTIATGTTLTLSAVAKDANGNAMSGQTFNWATSNTGVVTVVNGVVVAVGLGVATVYVTSGAFTDSAVITVSAPTTPTQSGPFNEPAGMTTFFRTDGTQRDFGSGWIKTAKWLDDQYTEVVPDATNPTGSGSALEKRWYTGQPGDNGNGLTTLRHFSDVGGFPARVLYVRLRVKFSPNYDVQSYYGGMKFGYWGMQGGPNATYMAWVDTDGLRPYVFLGAENPTPHKFGPSGTFKVGIWHTLEMVITAQTAKGAADGRYEWWINGTKLVDAQGQAFVNATSSLGPLIDGYQLYFIRGGANITFKIDDWARIGELYISGKK